MLHIPHLLQLVDKMRKYRIDLASTVEDTEQTWFVLQKDGQTDGRLARRMAGWTDGKTD